MPASLPFHPDSTTPLDLPSTGSWPHAVHWFDPRSVVAVNAALASRRPLLIRGEPGIGKSQLARAVAVALRVPFLPFVVDERTERDDLFYSFDAVARLAQAQVAALEAQDDRLSRASTQTALPHEREGWRARLAEENFFRPGVMWWAFDWEGAQRQADTFGKACRPLPLPDRGGWNSKSDSPCGPVVLVDEIDKADPAIPNGLLECLGNRGFQTAQLGRSVELSDEAPPPLIIITTNEDRELPAPFLRRCLVLQLDFPSTQQAVRDFLLTQRARVLWTPEQISDVICEAVIAQLLSARESARHDRITVPGAAEFLDLLRVLVELCPGDDAAQRQLLQQISDFALRKQRDEAR